MSNVKKSANSDSSTLRLNRPFPTELLIVIATSLVKPDVGQSCTRGVKAMVMKTVEKASRTIVTAATDLFRILLYPTSKVLQDLTSRPSDDCSAISNSGVRELARGVHTSSSS